MIHAYDKSYLDKAQITLGGMLDFAVHSLHMNPDSFFDLFIASGIAKKFEQGDVRTIAGSSGIELAYKVLSICGLSGDFDGRIHQRLVTRRSREILCGEAVAYYQWKNLKSFAVIVRSVPISNILSVCDKLDKDRRMKLAEAWPPLTPTASEVEKGRLEDIEAVCEYIDTVLNSPTESSEPDESSKSGRSSGSYRKASSITNLKRIRLECGLSQSHLAALSEVSLRTIQQYEQRQKNINKAQVDSVIRLAAILHCNPDDLLES